MIPFSELTRVLVVIGTRPEAIKMIPVVRALQDSGIFRPVVIATGEHTQAVNDLMRQCGLRTDANLRAAEPIRGRRPSRNETFARVLVGIDRVLASEHVPEEYRTDGRREVGGAVACIVHGDTTSAAAAAITAFNLELPVIHVEAGLRTSNLLSPFPEEGNRQLISRLAALHLAPTAANKANLVSEGVDERCIFITGNTSIDMLRWGAAQEGGFGPGLQELEADPDRRIVLITARRRENGGRGIDGIAMAVKRLAERYPETRFVVPMDPDPAARGPFLAKLWGQSNVALVEPRDYTDFARLMSASQLIITDSGGVQEEAPALGVPVLVAREATERTEGVEAGSLVLVGTDPDAIVREAVRLLDAEGEPGHASARGVASGGGAAADLANAGAARGARTELYGDGRASERIVAALDHILRDGPPPAGSDGDEMRDAVRRRLGLDEFTDRGR